MFMHQVIEDTERLAVFMETKDPLFTTMLHTFSQGIKSAHHFHLHRQCRATLLKQRFDKPVFTTCCDYLRMPYKLCWLDYYFEIAEDDPDQPPDRHLVTKGGMLVHESSPGEIMLVIFDYLPQGQPVKWFCEPVLFSIEMPPLAASPSGNVHVVPLAYELMDGVQAGQCSLEEIGRQSLTDFYILEQFMLRINSPKSRVLR